MSNASELKQQNAIDCEDHTTDKHGNPVSEAVQHVLEDLDEFQSCDRVMCDYHSTGRIQFFSTDRYVEGEVIGYVYRETDYEVDFVRSRPKVGAESQEGYMEIHQ